MLDFHKAYDSVSRNLLYSYLFKRAQSNEEKHIVMIIMSIFKQNELIYEGCRIKVEQGVMQGSKLSPFLFNVYLEETLMRSSFFKEKIENKALLAFSDDILVRVKDTNDFGNLMDEMELLGKRSNLRLNKNKTQFITDAKSFKNVEELHGVKRSDKAKYLGLNICLDR
jgi:hypothetical protein